MSLRWKIWKLGLRGEGENVGGVSKKRVADVLTFGNSKKDKGT